MINLGKTQVGKFCRAYFIIIYLVVNDSFNKLLNSFEICPEIMVRKLSNVWKWRRRNKLSRKAPNIKSSQSKYNA